MVAVGAVSAAQQEDAASGHGGRLSRTTAAAMGAGLPQGCESADSDPQARLYRKSGVVEPISGPMASRQTYHKTNEQARYPADRAQRSGSFGGAPCLPTRGGRVAGHAETDPERAS